MCVCGGGGGITVVAATGSDGTAAEAPGEACERGCVFAINTVLSHDMLPIIILTNNRESY